MNNIVTVMNIINNIVALLILITIDVTKIISINISFKWVYSMQLILHHVFESFISPILEIPYPALNYHYATDPQTPAIFTSGWQITRAVINAVLGL